MENSTVITKLNDLLSPFAAKIGNQRHLKAISSGMMFGLPFIVIGSFFLHVQLGVHGCSSGMLCILENM